MAETNIKITNTPRMAQLFFAQQYRINILIEEKSVRDMIHRRQIHRELEALLGISPQHLRRIRRTRVGDSGSLSVNQLTKLAGYFGVKIDELINTVYTSTTDTDGGPGTARPGVNLPKP